MKSVIISAVLAAIMITGALVYTNRLDNVSRNLLEMNESVSEYLKREDYNLALAQINTIKEYLEKKHTLLAAMGNHEELDKIEMNISELQKYTEGEMQTDALSRCQVLDFLFEHMPKNDYVRLENIL